MIMKLTEFTTSFSRSASVSRCVVMVSVCSCALAYCAASHFDLFIVMGEAQRQYTF